MEAETNKPWGKDTVWGTVIVANTRPPAAFARWLLSTIPGHSFPEYFSRSELLRRRPQHEVANAQALDRYLSGQEAYYFHTDAILLCSGIHVQNRQEVRIHARSSAKASHLLHDWIPALDRQGLFYVIGCAPQEQYHRNSVPIAFTENPSNVNPIWIGKDYERYVPGLYWLNYFSREFIARHRIDVDDVREGAQAEVRELENGFLVRLYELPEEWPKFTERIDEFLFSTPGFFSKRRVDAPQSVRYRDIGNLISRLGKEWP